MQSSSGLKKDSFFQGPFARALPGTDRNPTRGPPAARLSTGYSGRRPGHGVTGTTPVSHSGRALKACPRTPLSQTQSAPRPGTVPSTGTREATVRTPLEARARGSATRRPATCRGRRHCAQSRQYNPSEAVSTGPAYPHGKTWLPLSQTCLPPREGARCTAIRGLPARPTQTLRSIARARALLSHAWAVSSCAPCTPQGGAGATMAHRERARGGAGLEACESARFQFFFLRPAQPSKPCW